MYIYIAHVLSLSNLRVSNATLILLLLILCLVHPLLILLLLLRLLNFVFGMRNSLCSLFFQIHFLQTIKGFGVWHPKLTGPRRPVCFIPLWFILYSSLCQRHFSLFSSFFSLSCGAFFSPLPLCSILFGGIPRGLLDGTPNTSSQYWREFYLF